MRELDEVLGPGHEDVVDRALAEHRAHRHAAVADALATVIRSGVTPKCVAPKGALRRPKPVMTSSKIKQDAVLVADRAQPLEVALGGSNAGGAGHRLDDHRGDGRGVVQRDQAPRSSASSRRRARARRAEGVARQSCVWRM